MRTQRNMFVFCFLFLFFFFFFFFWFLFFYFFVVVVCLEHNENSINFDISSTLFWACSAILCSNIGTH